jgi:membrane protease YdiL (CAAX protease family)
VNTSKSVVFFSSYGLRSGWRSLFFVLILLAIMIPVMIPIQQKLRVQGHGPQLFLLMEAASAASVILATWICARFIEHKPFIAFGLGMVGAFRKASIGLLCGFLSLSFLIIILNFFGYEQFAGLSLHGSSIWQYGILWGMVFVLVAINEELTTRGYLLFTLSQGIGFWPAAFVLSLLFAAGHLHNAGEELIGIIAAGVIGVILAWTLKRTGSLWWAIGYHAAWDWAETYFYGVPDSGTVAEGHLLNTAAHGSKLLSGGSVGPEGSILVLPVVALLPVVVWLAFRPTPPPGLDRLR